MRDRLDQRFRLLVGSRRGLERHQTLRHAVAWSYDLLDDAEKTLLERCSVFAGGFDLQSACAVAGFDDPDDFAVLDLLDALVRKSLLVADRSSGRTRFSMLETIRQFAEEQLVARGEATEVRTAHARYFAGREADILALWDSPRQREAYTGSPSSWPIYRLRRCGPVHRTRAKCLAAFSLDGADEAGRPVVISSARLLKAFSHARLPCDRFAYGGQDHGKVFLLDERG